MAASTSLAVVGDTHRRQGTPRLRRHVQQRGLERGDCAFDILEGRQGGDEVLAGGHGGGGGGVWHQQAGGVVTLDARPLYRWDFPPSD